MKLHLGPRERRQAVELIQQSRSRFVKRQSHRLVIHDLELNGQTVRVVYDRKRASIVNVLPL